MLNKNPEEIKLQDLQQLVADGVPEGKTIEYKRDFTAWPTRTRRTG